MAEASSCSRRNVWRWRDNSVQDAKLRARIRSLGRQFLHAQKLGFIHPESQEPMQFTAPLPPDLLKLLSDLEERE
jgi:hypothetical protein